MNNDRAAMQTWILFYKGQQKYASPYYLLCDPLLLGKFFETRARNVAVSSLITALKAYFHGKEATVHMTRCCMLDICKDLVAEEFTHPCLIANCSHEEGAIGCSVRDLLAKLLTGEFGAPMQVHECQHTRPKAGVACLREVILRTSQKVIVATARLVDYIELYKVFAMVEWTEGKLRLGVPSDIWNEIVRDGTVGPACETPAGMLERGVW